MPSDGGSVHPGLSFAYNQKPFWQIGLPWLPEALCNRSRNRNLTELDCVWRGRGKQPRHHGCVCGYWRVLIACNSWKGIGMCLFLNWVNIPFFSDVTPDSCKVWRSPLVCKWLHPSEKWGNGATHMCCDYRELSIVQETKRHPWDFALHCQLVMGSLQPPPVLWL